MADIIKRLSEPFPPAKVSWRVGPTSKDKSKGMALAYIDARDVMDRLDDICGPDKWQSDLYDAGSGRLAGKIGILVGDQWIWKCDGAGGREAGKDGRGLSGQDANKGSFSDAFKRAAVQWGIGRYLYNVQSPWVELDQRERIKPDEQWKLDKALGNAGSKIANPSQGVGTQDNNPTQELTRKQKLIANRRKGKRYETKEDSSFALKAAMTFLPSANSAAEIDSYCKANERTLSALIDGHYAEFVIAMNDRKEGLPEGFRESA